MTLWRATAFAALDVRSRTAEFPGVELVVLPIVPTEPVGLNGGVAELWRSFVGDGRHEDSLTQPELELAREFESAGLATTQTVHRHALRTLREPWLESVMHELVYGLIASIAKDEETRVVFIKGPMLRSQALRERSHSGDVDAWVDPMKIAAISSALVAWGWSEPPTIWTGITSHHSVTLRPEKWGCEIDLHRHMPGCGIADLELFEQLWLEATDRSYASVDALVPSKAAHAVILALHELRPARGSAALERGKVMSVAEMLQRAGIPALVWATSVRADAAIEPALSRAFPRDFTVPPYPPPRNWTSRIARSRAEEIAHWLRDIELRHWPRFMFRLIWPTQEDIRTSDRAMGHESTNLVWSRIRRLGRAFFRSRWRSTSAPGATR